MKPVKQITWNRHEQQQPLSSKKKQLEATSTYTMISKEHLTTLEDRMKKEQEQ